MLQLTCIFYWLSVVMSYEKSSISLCLWHNNSCIDACPEWLVIKKSNCTELYWESQRTCEHPVATFVNTICGFARCDCYDPMVLDTVTGYCYDVDNCPTIHVV
ncbi:uncharacterized protein ACR2FA_001324 [Aphomia sociella]